MAGLMAPNAFAIDVMIPALPDIGESLGVAEDNHASWWWWSPTCSALGRIRIDSAAKLPPAVPEDLG